MFMVISSWPWSLREFTRFIWWMQTERQVAANPQTKPTDLGCESADKRLLPSTSTIAICYYYLAGKLILILPCHGGWRSVMYAVSSDCCWSLIACHSNQHSINKFICKRFIYSISTVSCIESWVSQMRRWNVMSVCLLIHSHVDISV